MNRIKLPQLDCSKPTFSRDTTTAIFVLGGPGAGKGTQCEFLAAHFPGFVHLSAGDLLREERNRPGSPFGNLINECIAEGRIVPMEITISLLTSAMLESGATKFLIDGFPRAVDQGIAFEKAVCEGSAVIFYECPERILEKRLLKRGECSGRADDNLESIRKRFKTFVDTTLPVIDYYKDRGMVRIVDSSGPSESVFEESCRVIAEIIKVD